ncbi:hypothetical protein KUCAC02_020900 [Chaenocephalus aceratus]|uniref:Uncharacterized protein n=1 Tax=Chaenocephalus aceratus TaxID=36190 RepID=A0ACB9XDU8_CHAAC|nr:hypothetical protein KUCAC02_020900 [Chaenocephalus aceratus]
MEPLVVLHVALTEDISDNIQSIVREFASLESEEDVNKIHAAIFTPSPPPRLAFKGWSWATTHQEGGARTTERVPAHGPVLQPVSDPGLLLWLQGLLSQYRKEGRGSDLLSEQEWKEVEQATDSAPGTPAMEALHKLITSSEGLRSERLARVLEPVLMRLCAWYLTAPPCGGLNWHADTSPRGVASSCGIMVKLSLLPERHVQKQRCYLQNKVITASEQVLGLVSQFQKNSKL